MPIAQPGNQRRPHAADGVEHWFEPLLAERLTQAGYDTLGALAARIDQAGPRWWYPVRGMGVTRAARVAAWVQAQQHGAPTVDQCHVADAASQAATICRAVSAARLN